MSKENDIIYLTFPVRNVKVCGDMVQVNTTMTGKELLSFLLRYVSGDESVGAVYDKGDKNGSQ